NGLWHIQVRVTSQDHIDARYRFGQFNGGVLTAWRVGAYPSRWVGEPVVWAAGASWGFIPTNVLYNHHNISTLGADLWHILLSCFYWVIKSQAYDVLGLLPVWNVRSGHAQDTNLDAFNLFNDVRGKRFAAIALADIGREHREVQLADPAVEIGRAHV